MNLGELHRINDQEWEIPRTYRSDMRGPVHVFATEELLQQVLDDRSLEQAVNATALPGLVGSVVVMPDVHQGYGFPIGGVAATEWPHGVVSPGAIGYDINCGVRLLASRLRFADVREKVPDLASRLYARCPSGVGKAGATPLGMHELEGVLRDGSLWALRQGYATEADLEVTEESGRIPGAKPQYVSDRAKTRGRPQLGSLGAGNHFIELDRIEQVFDLVTASAFGLEQGCLALQIHCGSRGLGHQVCTDYVRDFQRVMHDLRIMLPDRELVCAPLDTTEGRAYLAAMNAAANFAFANRQVLAALIREAFDSVFA
ncbi:MAG: RtcB family protein, partial [Anaerolineales bacterium]